MKDKTAVVIDQSEPILRELLEGGYTHVRWVKSSMACPICERLDGKVWTLKRFLSNLEHNAPIYEHSHPGCRCFVQVFRLKSPKEYDEFVDEEFPPVLVEAWGSSSF